MYLHVPDTFHVLGFVLHALCVVVHLNSQHIYEWYYFYHNITLEKYKLAKVSKFSTCLIHQV